MNNALAATGNAGRGIPSNAGRLVTGLGSGTPTTGTPNSGSPVPNAPGLTVPGACYDCGTVVFPTVHDGQPPEGYNQRKPYMPSHMWAGAARLQYLMSQCGARGISYEEKAVGPQASNFDPTIAFRPAFPELLTSDAGYAIDPHVLDGSRLLPSWDSDMDMDSLMSIAPDYPFVGSVASLRSAIETLYSFGVHDETQTTGVLAGTTNTATFTNGAGPTVGLRIDWGVSMLTYQPFTLDFFTNGWLGGLAASPAATGIAGAQVSADRSFKIRARGGVNGGTIWLPWATRSGQGMNYAMHTLAYATATSGTAGGAPTVNMRNLPAALAAAFNMTVTMLTAFSPSAAAWARIQRAYG